MFCSPIWQPWLGTQAEIHDATKNGIEPAETPENENKKNPNENQTSKIMTGNELDG